MKVLAIDAGNTRIKWAVHDGRDWCARGSVPTTEHATLAGALASEAGEAGLADVARIVVANVAGAAVQAGIAAAVQQYPAPVHWLAAQAECCGVRSGYADPAQLGCDRWAALIAARQRYRGPCIVANAGTTLTVDALTAEGVFLGGCIVPGGALMQDALDRNTARLRKQDGAFAYFPDTTADAIASGTLNALAGVVDRMLSYLQQAAGQEPVVVMSGGAAEALVPLLAHRVERVEGLVLEGLLHVAWHEKE